MSHTPYTPWTVADHTTINSEARPVLCNRPDYPCLASVHSASMGMPTAKQRKERDRLARVVAAAPDLKAVVEDMLSGLRYVRQRMEAGETDPWYGFGIDRLETTGRAAIAKAEGVS